MCQKHILTTCPHGLIGGWKIVSHQAFVVAPIEG
jgi:hypothetical protein